MSDATCSVPDCEKTTQARGWCSMHYYRWRRHGSTEPLKQGPKPCSVDGCDALARSRGWCAPHYKRWWKYGTPHAPWKIGHRYGEGATNPAYRGDEASYDDVHKRVRVAFGRAREHACVDCGDQAHHWSYDNADPDERRDHEGAYSLDISRYSPRCRTCHGAFDAACRRALA